MANDDRLTIKVKKDGTMKINKEGGASEQPGGGGPQISGLPGALKDACIVFQTNPTCAWCLQGGAWTKICWP